MPRHADDATRRAWHRRFQRFARSGQSVVRFCAREGVSVASFYHWRKKLKAPGPRRRRAGRRASFQPVTVVPIAPGVSVHLPCGARIEVRGADLDAVRAVVAEVTRASGSLQGEGGSC